MIRIMLKSDYDKVLKLWKSSRGVGLSKADSRENIEKFLDRNPGFCFVSIMDDEVVGAILCGHDGRRGYIHHLTVDEPHRGRGLGTKLMNQCLMELMKLKNHQMSSLCF